MPERRIDGISKMDAAGWSGVSLSKGGSNQLRVLSGQLSHIRQGKIMHALVQKTADGAFRVKLNGETFIFKGLPASLAGREIAFFVRKSGLKGSGKADLFWIGPNQSGSNPSGSNRSGSSRSGPDRAGVEPKGGVSGAGAKQAAMHAKVLSRLPAGLKPGEPFSARIVTIADGKMNLVLSERASAGHASGIQTAQIAGLTAGDQIGARILKGADGSLRIEVMQQPARPVAMKVPVAAAATADLGMVAGERATALVRERLPNGNLLLNVRGVEVEAPAPASVKGGDLLVLRMQRPPAGFQLLSVQKGAEQTAMHALKTNLSSARTTLTSNLTAIRNLLPQIVAGNLPETVLLPQLEQWFNSIEINDRQPLSGGRVARMIHDSGLALEPKLLAAINSGAPIPVSDIKALLLQMAAAGQGKSAQIQIVQQLAELGHQGHARIEAHQALNLLAAMHADPMRLELPMFVAGEAVNVQLLIEQQGQQDSDGEDVGGGSGASYSVLFALDLSTLGEMRVDAQITATSVHARIYSEHADTGRFLASHIQRLEERLQLLGFSEIHLLSTASRPTEEKQQRFDLLRNLTPSSSQLLDVRI